MLLSSFIVLSSASTAAYAANTSQGCTWHRVVAGDTLGALARHYHQQLLGLARTNHISNVNLIYIGQSLCIPYKLGRPAKAAPSGLQSDGTVRWYDYQALDYSSHAQVETLLRQAANNYGLPTNLLLAIAWQESGWNQHVIAKDGGIGTMQLMPYTALGLDIQTNVRHDPYKLQDNIDLGAIYLQSLWRGFHGNLTDIISAYNEGGWNVTHRGILNWNYVNDVTALMNRF